MTKRKSIQAQMLERIATNQQRVANVREREEREREYLQTLNKSQTPEFISEAQRRTDPAYVQQMADYVLVLRQSLR